MLEIEQKYANADFPALEARLTAWGCKLREAIDEADHYFNAPDRDFRQTGEAFRLRRIGTSNHVTFKGPRLDSQVKARRELEIALREGDQAANEFIQLLQLLGYRPVAIVCKHRRVFELTRAGFNVQVCLDDVSTVGRFAEVEILAPENRLEEVRSVLQQLAADLGLSQVEPRSYLRMFLEKREEPLA